MALTRADLLSTPDGQVVGKSQVYALLVDANGNAVLDSNGNEQVVEIQSSDGARLKVDTSNHTIEVPWAGPLTITDTAAHFLPSIDISSASDFYVMVNSTLNQDATVSITALDSYGSNGMEVMVNSPGQNIKISGTANQGRVSIIRSANLHFGLNIQGFVKCTTAPTSGSITLYIVKRP